MSTVNYHEDIAKRLEDAKGATWWKYTLDPLAASDLLDEWEDAQAMIRALNTLVDQLRGLPDDWLGGADW